MTDDQNIRQGEPRSPWAKISKRRPKYPLAISLKCSPAWLARLELLMESAGVKNRSQFVRAAVSGEPIRARPDHHLDHFRTQICRLNNNLNQAAQLARTEGTPAAERIVERVGDVQRLIDRVLHELHSHEEQR